MKEYEKDLLSTSARQVDEVISINKDLTEKTLRMRCLSYNAQIKAQLLTQTIYEIETSKKCMQKMNLQLVQARNELEQRVKERTTDLEKLNEKLQLEVGERKEAEKELEKHRDHLDELVKKRTKELNDTQKQLVLKDKLAAIGQVSSSIAHELRNPLATMQNSSYYLSKALKDADDKVKKHLTLIRDTVLLSNNIITSLLGLTKTKSLSLVKSDVNRVVKNVLAGFKTGEGITINTQLDENLLTIPLDTTQVLSVFKNIISNALQAMPEGGSLDIKTGVKDKFVEVEFKDTGKGISKENIQKIFEPLFTTKAKGIGLGLTLVKTIIDAHNGSILVESEIGKGTTFTLRFPIATETTQEKVLPELGQKT